MTDLTKTIKNEVVKRSRGRIKILKVSKPTKQLNNLATKIQSGIHANEEMRDRSCKNASNSSTFLR